MTVFHHVSHDGTSADDAARVDVEISQEFLNRIPGGIFRYRADCDERVDYFSQDMLAMYGCENYEQWEELTGNTFPGMVHPDDLERVEAEIGVQAGNDNRTRLLYRIVRRIGRLLDTHDMVIREAELKRKAEHDSLTGVLNRTAAEERVHKFLDGSDCPVTFILIDVDDFKTVNDVYGHPEGDRVLVELADHLRHACRADDIVARLGGDEFMVFAQGLGPGDALNNLVDRLARQDIAPLCTQLDDGSMNLMVPSISIGVATALKSSVELADLYQAADGVLYKSKEQGKSCAHFCVLDPSS